MIRQFSKFEYHDLKSNVQNSWYFIWIETQISVYSRYVTKHCTVQ